ncbi:hypothetical protein ACFSC4_29825 [Deinococcus malanensis]|uniref:hypothetical protein n=1 Tax=Deinococcus malanensis TaxID=1706855 RepID=UPI0036366D36
MILAPLALYEKGSFRSAAFCLFSLIQPVISCGYFFRSPAVLPLVLGFMQQLADLVHQLSQTLSALFGQLG